MSFTTSFRRNWPLAKMSLVRTTQILCFIHAVNETVFEVRFTTGASMLPTLSSEGDLVIHERLSFSSFYLNLRARLSSLFSSPFADSALTQDAQADALAARKRAKLFGTYPSTTPPPDLKLGDLVVSLSPLDPNKTVCKRVMGLPGDVVCVDPRGRWAGGYGADGSLRKGRGRPGGIEYGEGWRSTANVSSSPPLSSPATLGMENDDDDVEYIVVPQGHVWLQGDNLSNSTDSRYYGPVPLGLLRGKVLARVWPWPPMWLGNTMRDS